jgi:hypothetical protein
MRTTPVEIPLSILEQAYYMAEDAQKRRPEMFGGTLVDAERVLVRALSIGMEEMRAEVYGRYTQSK